VLGQRGAARTYLADDVDGLVVLKELSFFTPPDEATLAAFHQEARQLQALTHPRIPRYLDLLQLGTGVDTRLYLSQEFIEGTPLATQLSSRRATELEARELARQVLDILHYLQSRSPPVFHGDIKPANLIRRPDEALFLVDFGAAWVRGDADTEPSRYLPPDQQRGELDATTDFHALGVTLVDLLTWEPQWKRHAAGAEELASHLDVSPSFREFLARLTASEPTMRFTSVTEALRELEAPEQAPRPPMAQRRRLLMAAGAGAALLIFGAGFAAGRLTAPRPRGFNPRAQALPFRHPLPPPPAHLPSSPTIDPGSVAVSASTVLSTVPAQPTPAPAPLRHSLAMNHRPRDCEYAGFKSASASHHEPLMYAAYAFDRDPGTSWRSFPNKQDAWLQVDLGQSRTIDGLAFVGGGKAPLEVHTSLDGARWTPLIALTYGEQRASTPSRFRFPAQQARYVRLNALRFEGAEAFVSSFELYGPDCPMHESDRPDHVNSEL
jgi:serine/threonine protein kinase